MGFSSILFSLLFLLSWGEIEIDKMAAREKILLKTLIHLCRSLIKTRAVHFSRAVSRLPEIFFASFLTTLFLAFHHEKFVEKVNFDDSNDKTLNFHKLLLKQRLK